MNPRAWDRRKEVSQIEANDDALPAMRPGIGNNRSTLAKAMHGIMAGDTIQNLVQDLTLKTLEPGFRDFQEPILPRRFAIQRYM